MKNRYTLGNLLIATPPEWKEITERVDEEDGPFTLVKDFGVGALQISVGEYRSGKLPSFTSSDLRDLRDEFATGKGFAQVFDPVTSEKGILVCGGSYHVDDDFVRVWYCSNCRDIALVTYVSDWNDRNEESKECNNIVLGLKFKNHL
jgi:hypothetical protein